MAGLSIGRSALQSTGAVGHVAADVSESAVRQFQQEVRAQGDALRALHDPAGTYPTITPAQSGVLALGTVPDATPRGVEGLEQARAGRRDIAVIYGTLDDAHSYPYMLREIKALGAEPRMIPSDLATVRDNHLVVDGVATPLPEAVIARSMAEQPNLALLDDLERSGVHIVNRPSAIRAAAGKIDQASLAEKAGVPRPETHIVASVDAAHTAAQRVGYPAIVKLDMGSGGSGVFKVDTPAEMNEVAARHLTGPDRERAILVQELIPGRENDLRIHVVRDAATGRPTAISAMQRFAPEGSHVSNSLGGTTKRIALTDIPDEVKMAEKMADQVGADNLGVDVLPGARFGETNPTPGTTELDTPLPFEEHSLPRIAQYAVFGQRAPGA